VFVIPTAIFAALGLVGLLIYGGEGDDGGGTSGQGSPQATQPPESVGAVRAHAGQPATPGLEPVGSSSLATTCRRTHNKSSTPISAKPTANARAMNRCTRHLTLIVLAPIMAYRRDCRQTRQKQVCVAKPHCWPKVERTLPWQMFQAFALTVPNTDRPSNAIVPIIQRIDDWI
jgi:hypothetical protein